MTETLLAVENLSRSFGKVKAVQELSFGIPKGTIFGFIGPNGAGKTTTMRIIATLDLPDAGDALVDGISVLVEPRKVRSKVGFMSDKFEPYANIDVIQYLDFFARAYGLRGRNRIGTVRSVSEFCGLVDFKTRPANGLSKGMGQRLHLAKTLLHDPELLILDEPAAGLDPRARIEFRALLQELSSSGKSILISSHILSELGEICDGVIVIEKGRGVLTGDIEDLARDLKEHHRLRIRVASDLEAAQRFFLTQPHVQDLHVETDSLTFDFAADHAARVDLLRRALEDGHAVFDFHEIEADLEEIFMQTTKGKLG